jgi:hypothetical protein
MTPAEQASAIQRFGYTAREASFVVTAALHSGYFLSRQFTLDRGKVAVQFRRKILFFGHGTMTSHANGTRLMHLSAKPLYAALGQEDNRHRRRQEPAKVRVKVMCLDYVLEHPNHRFLPTEQGKLAYFCGERNIPESLLPTRIYAGEGGNTRRFFVDKYPIRIDRETGRVAFCYVDDGVFVASGFSTWLAQYAPLIRAIGDAEVVYVANSAGPLSPARREFSLEFPTGAQAISGDLLSYFEMRRDFDTVGVRGRPLAALDTMKRLRRTFSDVRFQEQYAIWSATEQGGAHASEVRSGPVFSTFELRHDYRIFGTVRKAKS